MIHKTKNTLWMNDEKRRLARERKREKGTRDPKLDKAAKGCASLRGFI